MMQKLYPYMPYVSILWSRIKDLSCCLIMFSLQKFKPGVVSEQQCLLQTLKANYLTYILNKYTCRLFALGSSTKQINRTSIMK